ncbi:hypothetical protein EV715DRAFT_208703 [Schizophyllum commune]
MDDDNDDVSAYSIEEYSGQPRGISVPAAQHVVQDAVKIVKDQADQSPDVGQPNADAAVGGDATDAHSIRSMPDTPVAPPAAAVPPRPATARTVQNAPVRASQSASVRQPAEHRSVERRSSAQPQQRATNRLSGFFTNLIHRRDPQPSTSRSTIREEAAKDDPSRSSSPHSGRPVTPPPQLPAPTLQELGLSLSVLTQDLSPSHFSTPPTSGAFLAPHYLLLCHAQGLDVLPLVSPPTPQPYALVRRVAFKSVVVMEQRGVLVAIAGRRDGVRVYALEEIRKAVEWRIEVEVRRERDRSKRDAFKKTLILSSPLQAEEANKHEIPRKPSHQSLRQSRPNTPTPSNIPTHATTNPPQQLIPRKPTITRRTRNNRNTIMPVSIPEPSEQPPPYSRQSDAEDRPPIPASDSEPALVHTHSRSRGNSVSNVLAAVPSSSHRPSIHERDSKADWAEDSSDDEAINIVAAAGGSQALDERTSAVAASTSHAAHLSNASSTASRPSTGSAPRRNRPANLDLSMSRANGAIPDPEPSPAPTLITLRQTLSHMSSTERNVHSPNGPDTPNDPDADDDDDDNGLSLAEMLMESRLPELPPAGTRRAQEPILLSNQPGESETEPSSPRTTDGFNTATRNSQESGGQQSQTSSSRRRRWSVMLSPPTQPLSTSASTPTSPASSRRGRGPSPTRPGSRALSQTRSHRSARSPLPPANRPPTAPSPSNALSGLVPSASMPPPSSPVPPLPDSASSMMSSRSSRFIPRLISNAFGGRRSDERAPLPSSQRATEADIKRTLGSNQVTPHAPPPKLEYVKLPGTKGALMVKAVETAKKSFLAILCGDNGEKVELFAGTYRTALGLSRTFILPDSPRMLELQLQGDDLVEVFLVFSQNVFGLEPATVRVREVRIGRAERRAARRRAREIRTGETQTDDNAADEETNVNVSVSVAVTNATPADANGPGTPPLIADQHPDDQPVTPAAEPTGAQPSAASHADELLALASAQMGPYTTFQQLSFAPRFPLAAIADDYIIPPTYPDFIDYRNHHESDSNGSDLTRIQFSPPGLPVPTPSAPCKWFYRDPKGVVHGPWKASLMQAWFKDGLLPLDLPVRREEDSEYILLKDLRLQCVDPTRPFRSAVQTATPPPPFVPDAGKPLLPPISLLAQPKHFGPPALFFSSRGGHSTAIVDARGRSVLKGRFLWSSSDPDEDKHGLNRLGDVKRLEAFDVEDGAVLVAMRQGGLEAVDFSDALLKPADASRTVLPQFEPPPSNINRRSPFVWRIGTPVDMGSSDVAPPLTPKAGKGSSYLTGRKPGSASARNLVRTELNGEQATDTDPTEEVLFLGRRGDNMYMCERSAGSFRILHLRPSQPSASA